MPLKGTLRATLIGAGILLSILFILSGRRQWHPPVFNKTNATVGTSGRTNIEQQALDGSWKIGLTVKTFNEMFLARVDACLAGGPCAENNQKIVVLSWHHFEDVITGIWGGETVWCDNLMDVMYALGYSMVIALRREEYGRLWMHYHKNIQVLLSHEDKTLACLDRSDCVFFDPIPDEGLPPPSFSHLNIPIWKFFHMNWWNSIHGPLGAPFTVSPEDYTWWRQNTIGRGNYFLGYSVEKGCSDLRLIPPVERPRQIYILGKLLRYLYDDAYIMLKPGATDLKYEESDFYVRFGRQHNVTFVGQLSRQQATDEMHWPKGVKEVPHLTPKDFPEFIAQNLVTLGIGEPLISPTPYQSLCLGVPFINPVRTWDHNDPQNRDRWQGQADGLIAYGIDEPYVYHVLQGDMRGLERALVKALNTPIEKFILPHMKIGELVRRMVTLLETDWEPTARAIIREKAWKPPY